MCIGIKVSINIQEAGAIPFIAFRIFELQMNLKKFNVDPWLVLGLGIISSDNLPVQLV